ncbi:MAG: hypothetical protein ABIK73_07855 [candidate division WOR-3 bacterium]
MDKKKEMDELVFVEEDYTPENVSDGCAFYITFFVIFSALIAGCSIPCF